MRDVGYYIMLDMLAVLGGSTDTYSISRVVFDTDRFSIHIRFVEMGTILDAVHDRAVERHSHGVYLSWMSMLQKA